MPDARHDRPNYECVQLQSLSDIRFIWMSRINKGQQKMEIGEGILLYQSKSMKQWKFSWIWPNVMEVQRAL